MVAKSSAAAVVPHEREVWEDCKQRNCIRAQPRVDLRTVATLRLAWRVDWTSRHQMKELSIVRDRRTGKLCRFTITREMFFYRMCRLWLVLWHTDQIDPIRDSFRGGHDAETTIWSTIRGSGLEA